MRSHPVSSGRLGSGRDGPTQPDRLTVEQLVWLLRAACNSLEKRHDDPCERLGGSWSDHDLIEALLMRSDHEREAWVHAHPDLAELLAGWVCRSPRSPLSPALRAYAPTVWVEQRAGLLAAPDAIACDDPNWRGAARLLLDGQLAPGYLIDFAQRSAQGDKKFRADRWQAYEDERDAAVDRVLATRPRPRWTAAEWAALARHHDHLHLVTCRDCGVHEHQHAELMSNGHCYHCGGVTGPYDPTPAETTVLLHTRLERTTQRPPRRPARHPGSRRASACIGQSRDGQIAPDIPRGELTGPLVDADRVELILRRYPAQPGR